MNVVLLIAFDNSLCCNILEWATEVDHAKEIRNEGVHGLSAGTEKGEPLNRTI